LDHFSIELNHGNFVLNGVIEVTLDISIALT